MFLQTSHRGFIVLLSSIWAAFPQGDARLPNDLKLGTAIVQTAEVTPGGAGEIIGEIVVRVTSGSKVESFGITNEVGILVMPLPPGKYCYDAFSHNGKALRSERKASDRCFQIRSGAVTEVGIGLLK